MIWSICFIYSSANKCLLKVASYSAQLEQYPKAIEIYEQVRHLSISCRFLQHCLVTHQLCVCVCVRTGWIQHHGQSPSEIQRQRILLQSCFVSLHRGRAKRKGLFSVEDAQIVMENWYRWWYVFIFCCSSLLESMKRCFQPSQIQENANFWRFVIIEFVTDLSFLIRVD